MHPFKEKLETLKKMLDEEKKFSVTFNYFFDHLGEDPYFFDSCKKTKNPLIKEMLKHVGEQLFDDDGMVTNLKLLKYPKANFYHGSCFVHGRTASLFFFEDIKKGMAAVHISPLTSEVKYIRLTGTVIEGNKAVIIPDTPQKVLH
jgi:hypothetical protein